ncbi:MAG: DMT family transporter [Alphaproteobacteria bacterium]|jgi:drug/metabolite transporter (DMT)-like permease|nr:DMT family transporter [Alphaproteobacteria bacterium]
MDAWIWIGLAFFAAAMQSVRTAGQKVLTGELDSASVALVRFLFGAPFAYLYLLALMRHYGTGLPTPNLEFILLTLAASTTQIAGTVLLVHLFSLRNFAVGNAYARTEALLTALVGTVLFAELLSLAGWVAIAVSVAGVVLISLARTGTGAAALLTGLWNRAALIGVASGLGFALSSLLIRRASLSFGDERYLFTAGLTLATMVTMQTVILSLYLLLTQPGQFRVIARRWRVSLFIGATSILGSFGWFTAMTIERAAYVKAVGQVELVMTLAISMLFFRERTTARELVGMALLSLGIVVLLVTL